MTHLNGEQFEDVLRGDKAGREHLAGCRLCRDRLAEMRAVRGRLRKAFETVHVGGDLAERIRKPARAAGPAEQAAPDRRRRTLRLFRWVLPLTAAAAAILIGVVVLFVLPGAEPALAAHEELFEVHQHALSPHVELYSADDPAMLAEYLRDKLGFTPAFPRLGAGMSMRGCCVSHFRDRPVGSYVVETPRGVISVIVVAETPESLGMKDVVRRGGRTYLAGSFARCNMVTSRQGGYTYCAVGEVPKDLLADLLDQLVQ